MLIGPLETIALGFTAFATDLCVWRLNRRRPLTVRVGIRVLLFVLYSAILFHGGISPLQAAPWPQDTSLHMSSLALAIIWWLLGARTLSEVLGALLDRRIGHNGRLLKDVVGALTFLAAVVAAAGYVIELPVKGLLATSGALAIIVGLALQSTLSDLFSGIVLNATKPYQVDDQVAIDGAEGKVLDINWRATQLLTGTGALAVIPNSVAAKAKITNFSRPAHRHGVSITLSIPNHVRPGTVLDALERALRGTHALLTDPPPGASVKDASAETTQYVASGYITDLERKAKVRNQMFDLAYRHLEAAGVAWSGEVNRKASWTRSLLDEVRVLRSLSSAEKDRFVESLVVREVASGAVILDVGEVPEELVIIASGVVSVTIPDGDGPERPFIEAGRMGPAEVLGEQSVLDDCPSGGRFTAMTTCQLLTISRPAIRACIADRAEIGQAIGKLHAYRVESSRSLLTKPAKTAEAKVGFLAWLQRHSGHGA